MYVVEFIFDKKGENIVKELFSKVPCESNKGILPHISLSVYNDLNLDTFIPTFLEFKKSFIPLNITFDIIGTFPSTKTCFIKPTVTESLLCCHQRYLDIFKEYIDYFNPYCVSDKWNPHCSIGFHLSDSEIRNMLDILLENFKPFECTIVDVILIEVNEENSIIIA